MSEERVFTRESLEADFAAFSEAVAAGDRAKACEYYCALRWLLKKILPDYIIRLLDLLCGCG